MERDTFDRLTRLIGVAGTRRAALRLAATGALLGGTTTINSAAASVGYPACAKLSAARTMPRSIISTAAGTTPRAIRSETVAAQDSTESNPNSIVRT